MHLGRNDPCHCGSGRKYKKCHEAEDREAERAPGLRLLRGAAAVNRVPAAGRGAGAAAAGRSVPPLALPPAEALAGAWEVAVSPFPASLGNDPAARLVVVLLVVGGYVAACRVENRPSEEPEVLAALMAEEVLQLVAGTRVRPPRVLLRQRALEGALGGVLRPHGIAVDVASVLPALDHALRDLMAQVGGGPMPPGLVRSQPEMWAGWGLPDALVARLFQAAAVFHRQAPWEAVPSDAILYVSRPGETEWGALVLGAGGQQEGLSLFQDPEDFARMVSDESADAGSAFAKVASPLLSLLYNYRDELPKSMRTEIRDARWAVAGPDAYPTLQQFNTPGGGVREGDAQFLLDVLEALPRFVAAVPEPFVETGVDDGQVTWRDAETGVLFRVEPGAQASDDVMTWYETLAPSGPAGPGATPGAGLAEADADAAVAAYVAACVARFRAWLGAPGSGKPVGEGTAQRHAQNVQLFVEYGARVGQKPMSAVTEYDLRDFLYSWYPVKVMDSDSGARGMLVSLRRFFAFLRAHEGVACPWAASILSDTAYFLERWATRPDRFLPQPEDELWHRLGSVDLMARVLLPNPDPAGPLEFGAMMGAEEFDLFVALHRQWLLWRDEVIASGVVAPRAVLEALRARTAAWSTTPPGGDPARTPLAVIAREREAMRRRAARPSPRRRR